jgi:hypothetical protein
MADMLSHGPDRDPSRWTSPLTLAVAGIVLVAIVLLGRGIFDRAHRPAGGTSAPTVTPPSQGPPVPFGVAVNGGIGSKEPTRFSGLITTSGVGRLLLNGPKPGWLQTATGRFEPISGLPPWGPGYGFTRAAGGWAVQRYSPPQASCQVCDAPPAVYFIRGQSARATVVGSAYDAAAAASQGDLWLTAYLPDADIGIASGTTQEVTTAGTGVGPPSQLPAGYVIDRAVKGGLLLAAYEQGAGPVRDYLWDPITAQVKRDFTNVIAASPDLIAWDPCLGKCPLEILRLPAMAGPTIRLPHGAWAVAGTFSADGRLLAVQVTTDVQRDGSAAATRLEVINTATGQATVLPGSKINSLIGVGFGWQAGSDRLLAAIALPSGLIELASWQPGDTQLSIQAVRLPAGTSPVLGDHA